MQKYDVCLSFAGPDRDYVAEVAQHLRHRAVNYFYDADEQADLWGTNLPERLAEIYGAESRYCVMFVSAAYLASSWTLMERRIAVAHARKLRGPAYVLPVVLDDTEVPAELGDVVFMDGRTRTPAQLVDLLCQKLRHPAAEGDRQSSRFAWTDPLTFRTWSGADRIPIFQQVPAALAAPSLSTLIGQVMLELGRKAVRSGDEIWWSYHEDRRFDRLYASASVVTALLQSGVSEAADTALPGLAYLRRADPGKIDDRAATILRLVAHDLSEDEELAFIESLAEHVIKEEDSPLRGSMLLPQGPIELAGAQHWTASPMHAGGASFHACHIGETLLSIPQDHPEARARARVLLDGIRGYLVRVLETHDGWLVDARFRRSPQTIYAYSVLPGLAIPLPANWRANAMELFEATRSAADHRFRQFLQVANAWYLHASVRDPEFRAAAADFAQDIIQQLTSVEIAQLNVRDLAALLRAIGGAVRLVDERFAPIVTMATLEHIEDLRTQARG